MHSPTPTPPSSPQICKQTPQLKLSTDNGINYAKIIAIYHGHIEYTVLYVLCMHACVCVCV